MLREGTGQSGRFARLILLACTLFGLATMHTLGHSGMQMHAHDAHAAETVAAAVSGPAHGLGAMDDGAKAAPGGVCDGGCADAPGQSPHGGLAGWGVCLAVLAGLAFIVLLAMVFTRSRRGRPPGADPARWAVLSRGPPVRPAALAMAAVSVLRI